MAIQTFGVNETILTSYLPQVDIATDAPNTPTRVTEIIEGESAYFASIVVFAYGSDITSDFASDSASLVYRNCQRIIVILALPIVLQAAFMGSDQVYQTALLERNALIKRLVTNPQMEIGYALETPASIGQTYSSVKGLGLALDDDSASMRRRYDGRAGGLKERGFRF
jgi:hypothetical protein